MRKGEFVPMEFVEVEAVKVTKITDEQRANLCLQSSVEPSKRYPSIKEIRQNPKQQCFEKDPFVAAWNLNVEVDMVTVPARILPMPDIICDERTRVTDKRCTPKGVWNNTKIPFFKPTAFPSVWALINLSLPIMDRVACEAFCNELSQIAADRGIQCPVPLVYEEYNIQADSNEQIIDALKGVMEHNEDCKFFIVILPADKTIRDRIYGDIKELVK
jgi:hypothetical protein